MTEYEQQANDFLKSTGATIEARYVALKEHFIGDGENRDVYEIRMRRGSREYVTAFGTSIADTEKRIESQLTQINKWRAKRIRQGSESFEGYGKLQRAKWYHSVQEWAQAGSETRPSAYDILTCITWYEPSDNVDDFASEFGYTKPSEALRVFEAVQKEYAAMQSLFTDDEIALAQEIS